MADSGSGTVSSPISIPATETVANLSLNTLSDETFTAKRKADQLDALEEQPAIKLVEVGTDGDLALRVGSNYTGQTDGPLDIKIARYAMKSGSPVFAKMLSSKFMENEAAIIGLPEESPKAFLEFCNILHHKTTNLDHLTAHEVWELAIIADMRQAQHVLRPWILDRTNKAYMEIKERMNVRRWQLVNCQPPDKRSSSCFGIGSLIEIGAIFGLAGLFWAATRGLLFNGDIGVYHTNSQELLCLPSVMHPNGENVYEVIAEAAHAQSKAIFTDVSQWVNKGFVHTGSLVGGKDWTCQARKHGTLHMLSSEQICDPGNINELSRLVPVKAALARVSQLKLCLILPGHAHATEMLGTECTMATQSGSDCDYCKRDFGHELEELQYSHHEKVLGICLMCFKAGKKDCFTSLQHAESCTGR